MGGRRRARRRKQWKPARVRALCGRLWRALRVLAAERRLCMARGPRLVAGPAVTGRSGGGRSVPLRVAVVAEGAPAGPCSGAAYSACCNRSSRSKAQRAPGTVARRRAACGSPPGPVGRDFAVHVLGRDRGALGSRCKQCPRPPELAVVPVAGVPSAAGAPLQEGPHVPPRMQDIDPVPARPAVEVRGDGMGRGPAAHRRRAEGGVGPSLGGSSGRSTAAKPMPHCRVAGLLERGVSSSAKRPPSRDIAP